ncbi:MAG: hypothetical protein M4579_002372 [Chaenotheca gracillima]|nr:MAG: hypothetical protein M4579_002372 [Chaenotheca gracillima]
MDYDDPAFRSVSRRPKETENFTILEDPQPSKNTVGLDLKGDYLKPSTSLSNDRPGPLMSFKLPNKVGPTAESASSSSKKPKLEHPTGVENENITGLQPMDQLLAKLTQQQDHMQNQRRALAFSEDRTYSTNGLTVLKSTSESSRSTPSGQDAEKANEENELTRLKRELFAARNKIAKMDQELSQTRITKHTLDQALGSPTEVNFPLHREASMQNINQMRNNYDVMKPASRSASEAWTSGDDMRSERSDNMSMTQYNGRPAHWGAPGDATYREARKSWEGEAMGPWSGRSVGLATPQIAPGGMPGMQPQGFRPELMPMNHHNQIQANQSLQNSGFNNGRGNISPYNQRGGWPAYPSNVGQLESVGPLPPFHPAAQFQGTNGYQPRPIGTPLSPTAAEFPVSQASGYPWNDTSASTSPQQTYVSPIEPLNYRRMLDRTVTCDWKYIVDKIVCNNDQQASIFLQQKLKAGTPEQKHEIVDAIVSQAYPLMVNRFGNFLVQRCFEHGTPEQVVSIANAIRGNTLTLSMDSFGCHVIQKAFDCVPESFKAIMVHELLRRIPETVIHRYACHVWQKLFELRWSDSPPQIMKYVNDALCGMWHEVALGETGSLVVQNIFENCLEEDKRPCINEVLNSIDLISRGQFGNWCIQHICEHAAPADRSSAIDHVVRHAVEYSMDQFASKAVEKCLKIGGSDFLDRYLDRICEGRHDRPRIPLIDIASDQFGNYLIQYILTHTNSQHREIVATHVRKHMVSLRGSKFGSRVGMLCCNPASATRPGPAVGPPVNRFMNGMGGRFGGGYR